MKIVIIDSGLWLEHPGLHRGNLVYNGLGFYKEESSICSTQGYEDEIGHGTAITSIISKAAINYCDNAEIHVIKIFNDTLEVDVDTLIAALRYTYESIKPDIINMSLGVLCDNFELHELCKECIREGSVIVSAFNNDGAISFPAAYPEVIGVDTGLQCVKANQYIYIENSILNLLGKGDSQRVAWRVPEYIVTQGSSYAAAHITANIVGVLASKGKEDLRNVLKQNALFTVSEVGLCEVPPISFNIKKAVVFPYNKEIHSLIHFEDILPFKIEQIYDTKYSGQIGKKVCSLKNKEYTIQNIDDADFSSIDTIIVGHLSRLKKITKFDYFEAVTQKASDKIQVYSLDVLSNTTANIAVNKSITERSHLSKSNKLYHIESPVLGILGTSSSQGKFTLQLKLRSMFMSEGYRVGQLGTEPASPLFGMEEIYCFGYGSQIEPNSYKVLDRLNTKMHIIDSADPDVIIVGCQSGTVPFVYYDLNQYHLPQLAFLLGTLPDIVVLCVNLYDDISYIGRTIKAIESLSGSIVIALALYPQVFDSDWQRLNGQKKLSDEQETMEFSLKIENIFGLNVFRIDNGKQIKRLYDHIINNLC